MTASDDHAVLDRLTTRPRGAQHGPRWLRPALLPAGVVLAVLIGVFHIVPVPEYTATVPWLGWTFLVGGLAPFAAALAMAVPVLPSGLRRLAIQLMALASALMIVMSVASRTVGLPGLAVQPWDAILVVSLALEAAFLVLSPFLLVRRSA